MPKQKRNKTDYKGVYFVSLSNEKKSYFIRYKHNGKSYEERAGRNDEGWDSEKAYDLRIRRITEKKDQISHLQLQSNSRNGRKWNYSKIFERYLKLRPELKGRENDIYRFRNYIQTDFADKTPPEVTNIDVERFRDYLQNSGLKPATVRHVLELLRRLSNFAAKKRYCRGLSFKISMPKVENQKTEHLSDEQLKKLLNVLDEESDFQASNLVRLALYTGMRRGELFALKWSDVDFIEKIITVKTGKGDHYPKIPLNEMAQKVLSNHAKNKKFSEFVFPGRDGKKRTECKRPLIRIRKQAELPDDFRILQGLRHVYASKQATSGTVDLKSLQLLLTHKSPLMTKRYAHMVKKQSQDAEKINCELKFIESKENLNVDNFVLKEDVSSSEELPNEESPENRERYKDEEIVPADPYQSENPESETVSRTGFVNIEESLEENTETDTALGTTLEPFYSDSEAVLSSSEELPNEESPENRERYEDEEIVPADPYQSESLNYESKSENFPEINKSTDNFKSNEIDEFSAEEFYKETGREKSRIEELTEFDGQLDLFDTFEPEEIESEEIFKNSNENVSFLEGIPKKEVKQDIFQKNDMEENLERREVIKEFNEEKKDFIPVEKKKDENVTLVEEKLNDKEDQIKLEEEVYDEAVNAVFGEKKVTEIDTWARKEAEAMSARAEEGARKDKNLYQKESTSDIGSKNTLNGNDSKINERPSMKELKKDLKSLSELINSAPVKIKDSDKENN